MKREKHSGRTHALAAFFAGSGIVLALVVGVVTVRSMVAASTQTWSLWTPGWLALLGIFAILLWTLSRLVSAHVHRVRRDRVHTFLTAAERTRVLEAVAQFERMTSGEIRVHLAEHSGGDPTRMAARVFEQLGMTATHERNGVLFFVSVHDRHVAVIGDSGIHERVPDGFWNHVVQVVESAFAEERYAEGLVDGIAMAGARLAEHFPHRPGDVNELPDDISDDTR
ncbi:MAG TPA: TPM domain-containing protein [Candidatus Krumholzibacteria bacterium]|nr:TPM domain-containing protein [Candidatus Krumholzibacteria bacterium]